jgi:hypothetical protein
VLRSRCARPGHGAGSLPVERLPFLEVSGPLDRHALRAGDSRGSAIASGLTRAKKRSRASWNATSESGREVSGLLIGYPRGFARPVATLLIPFASRTLSAEVIVVVDADAGRCSVDGTVVTAA